MECIALIGRAGSGKSTIGKILAGKLGFTYISTGDIARAMEDINLACGGMADETSMRRAFKFIINMCEMHGKCQFVIDGMPRTAEQVDFLREVFKEVNFIEIETAEDIAVRRLLARGRSDDNEQNIGRRQDIYNQEINHIKSKILNYCLSGKIKSYRCCINDNMDTEGVANQILIYIKTKI